MREFGTGVGYLAQGFRFWGRRPKIMLLGMIPAAITALLLVGALVALAFIIVDLSAWLTSFAADWGETTHTVLQVMTGILVFGLAFWLCLIIYTALTLLIGDPCYEKISQQVEAEFGPVPEFEEGWWASIGRSIADALRLLVKSLAGSILLFAVGLIPVLGSVIALVLGAFVGGWFLAVELSAAAFNRRGWRYRQYRKILGRHRARTLGLGTAVFLLFLIPLGAVIVMPAAVAGATLLVRDVVGTNPAVAPRPPHAGQVRQTPRG